MNAMDRLAREYPISTLIEYLRDKMQDWFFKRRTLANETTTTLTPAAEKMLVERLFSSRGMIVKPSTGVSAEVIDLSCKAFVVNLEERRCTCREFQLEDFVCVHAVNLIGHLNGLSCYDYVSAYYKTNSWRGAYSGIVYPIGSYSEDELPEEYRTCLIKPPICKTRTAGRPKSKRIRSVGEFGSRQKCTRCKQQGHNQKTCNNPIPL
ncbi:unnamed protein product [Cuscuta epithymum]|uniref:SWIM-type domain-containing protein n=1 Tax=Cuscuta epithymum TaxID=186058 RepID=A0AAV0EDP2_9ASTE|nr:unnamed protein product [Cuscuta epithymum]